MQEGGDREPSIRLLEPGEQFGDYVVEQLLGKGGMGAVYLVRSPRGERYAIKVMYPSMLEKNRDYRKRFAREAEFAMKIRHKNLISVYDVGEDPETGLCYIIMDYVPGGTVADRLEREGKLPMEEAVSIVSQVALALDVAHRHGVVHRDIKPDNIMFGADGTPRLADLGVAKFSGGTAKTTVTTTGMVIGTPAYMAPEQMIDSHNIDARADIYALGVVLYEMLTGKRPREGSTAVELLAKAIKGEPIPDVRMLCPEISAAVAYVLSLMCSPNPEGRPATALETAKMLRKALDGSLVIPKKSPSSIIAEARKARRKWVTPLVSAVFAALLSTTFTAVCLKLSTNDAEKTGTGVPPSPPSLPQPMPTPSTRPESRHPSPPPSSRPKFHMKVNEDALKWLDLREEPFEPEIRLCHDLSHGGFPGANKVFSTNFFDKASHFKTKTCWHDIVSENLDSVNVLVLPPSSAQVLYSKEENAAISRFLSRGGTVIAFVAPIESNVWSMNSFFEPYGLTVFVSDGVARKDEFWGEPSYRAFRRFRPKMFPSTFAAPANGLVVAEWSRVLTEWDGDRVVFASRRVGKGNLVYAAAGLMWGHRDANGNPMPITSEENKKFWLEIFRSAARNRIIPVETPMGERAVTDTPIRLPVGPITIYSSNRWKNNANRLCEWVRQALPLIERYCGRSLDPNEMAFTKYVLVGTSIGGGMQVGPKTLVISATYGGFPDKIQDLSVQVFNHMARGVVQDDGINHLSCYIANRVFEDMGYPGRLASCIDEGKRLDPGFSKYRLTDGTVLRDENGNKVKKNHREIVHAKVFSALDELRSRHPYAIHTYITRRKRIAGKLSWSQCARLFTDVTGEDCFKLFLKYGIECSPDNAAITPEKQSTPPVPSTPQVTPSQSGATPSSEPPQTASSAVRHIVFPCADLTDTKWRSRASWRYMMKFPKASSTSRTKRWSDYEFLDGSWNRTNKPLGIGKGNALMRVAEKWNQPSLYLRRHFDWKGGTVKRVELTICQDCSINIYLNGTSVFYRTAQDEGWHTVEVPADEFAAALRKGDNVLAVYAYEYSKIRYFDCGLTVETEE